MKCQGRREKVEGRGKPQVNSQFFLKIISGMVYREELEVVFDCRSEKDRRGPSRGATPGLA
jgi:hypothetical protein